MNVLVAVLCFIGGMLVGFALGWRYGFDRALDQWRLALGEPIEKTSERERKIK
jgi:hypothetical protein